MLEESNELIGLDVYGPNGIFVGKISDMVMDPGMKCVSGIIVKEVNPALSEPGIIVCVPYAWVSAVGDIVLLKRFPTRLFRNAPPEGL